MYSKGFGKSNTNLKFFATNCRKTIEIVLLEIKTTQLVSYFTITLTRSDVDNRNINESLFNETVECFDEKLIFGSMSSTCNSHEFHFIFRSRHVLFIQCYNILQSFMPMSFVQFQITNVYKPFFEPTKVYSFFPSCKCKKK